MSKPAGGVYLAMRGVLSVALGFYFRRLERFHAERVPLTGPVLFTSNHPNSLTDSFIIGFSVPRKVNFVATVQLFRVRVLKWLLSSCGVIPINRAKDDPRAMRTVAETFEACFRVLESGEAVGIFPEGITYNDARLKEIKPGAARMALELEHRHHGRLGLQIVPVGLTYAAKEKYRSDTLVNFGEPIRVADFLDGYEMRRKECQHRLTAEIERRLQQLILHLPKLEQARVVSGVCRLYLEKLRLGHDIVHEPISSGAEDLLLTQRIAEVVAHVYEAEPDRAARFAMRLAAYEGWLRRLRISDADLALFPAKASLARRSFAGAALALLGAPVALYGWLHRLLPFAVVHWAVRRFTQPGKHRAQASTAALAAGMIAFVAFYGAYIAVFQALFGWPASLWYALSIVGASLLAHYYLVHLQRLANSTRNAIVLVRAPLATRRLLATRRALIDEIEAVRDQLRTAALPTPARSEVQ